MFTLCLQEPSKNLALVDGRTFRTALVSINEPRVINAQSIKDRGVDVVDMESVFNSVKAEIVGFSNDDTRSHSSTGHPHGESVRIMVAAIPFLRHGRAAELTPPDNQRLLRTAHGA